MDMRLNTFIALYAGSFLVFWGILFSLRSLRNFFQQSSYLAVTSIFTVLFYSCFLLARFSAYSVGYGTEIFCDKTVLFSGIAILSSLVGVYCAYFFFAFVTTKDIMCEKKVMWGLSKKMHNFQSLLAVFNGTGVEILLKDEERNFIIAFFNSDNGSAEYVLEARLYDRGLVRKLVVLCYPAQKGQFVEKTQLRGVIERFI